MEKQENNIKSTIISPRAVQTELYKTINDKEASAALHQAQAVAYVIDTLDRVSVSDMIIRPTAKEV